MKKHTKTQKKNWKNWYKMGLWKKKPKKLLKHFYDEVEAELGVKASKKKIKLIKGPTNNEDAIRIKHLE